MTIGEVDKINNTFTVYLIPETLRLTNLQNKLVGDRINIEIETAVLGGAGNVVNNLKKLGSNVDIVSVIGKCKTSVELKKHLNEIGVETKFLIEQKDRTSSKKTRVISSQQQVVRYDHESTDEISDESQKSILASFKKLVSNYDVVLLSDYGKGVLTIELTQSLIAIANNKNKKGGQCTGPHEELYIFLFPKYPQGKVLFLKKITSQDGPLKLVNLKVFDCPQLFSGQLQNAL